MRAVFALLAIGLLAGCASTKVAMYDGETSCTDDGGATTRQCETGAVAVIDEETGEDVALIDRADTQTRATSRGARVREVERETLDKRYGATLGGMPEAAKPFTLNFAFDSETDLVDSEATLQALFAEVGRRRDAVDVDVIGHSDTSGDDAANEALALQRAEFIKTLLIGRGLADEVIHVSGRGELEPIDNPGVDNFASNKNRRVEVLVK